ncbi:hypothetical protein MUN84_19900 [Hymenobacter sp. 5516J-16]|uniref:hypothetical protein n=1 Tax=Hymenobacter sp. 5516J-16 TaxID=2932253 RepID=UPI001FD5F848|nr:hypothetical protein [Hymenobacter sp. 5516J-16]UOQ76748.1 hypothetical protein MUN84_19900 [Hymenobacter sp. 5516J-16]
MPSFFLQLLLRRFALLLFIYMLLRLGFYWANHAVFQEANTAQVLQAFWHGIRFDMAALLLLNLPFVLLSLVPRAGAGWQGLVRGVYLTLNATGIALNLIDTQYFKFIGRRTSNELLTITGDIQRQAGQLAGHYWFLLIPFVLLFGLLWYAYPLPSTEAVAARPLQGRRRWLQLGLELLLVAGLTVLGIRGGLQLKPLRTGHAFVQTPPLLGHVTLNSTFTFLKSLGYQPPERRSYFSSAPALRQALAAHEPTTRPGATRPPITWLFCW